MVLARDRQNRVPDQLAKSKHRDQRNACPQQGHQASEGGTDHHEKNERRFTRHHGSAANSVGGDGQRPGHGADECTTHARGSVEPGSHEDTLVHYYTG